MPRERNEPAGIERALKAAMTLSPKDLGKVVRDLNGSEIPPKALSTMAYIEETYALLSPDGRSYLAKKLIALHDVVAPKPVNPQPAVAPETGTTPQ
jgi:hypothetical protein